MDNSVRNRDPTEDNNADTNWHFIGGPGGSRAILAVSGVLLALKYFGIKKFKSVGGISGGSLPLELFAQNMSLEDVIATAIDLKFLSLLDSDSSMTAVMADHYRSGRYRGERPAKGMYRSDKLGTWIESFSAGNWPESFWTMAVEGEEQVLLCPGGVYTRAMGEEFTQISDQSPALGASIRASCSVPGWFTPVELSLPGQERKLKLYDGGLSWEGRQPISVLTDHFQVPLSEIIICDVGVEPGAYERIFGTIWKMVCGGRCITPMGNEIKSDVHPIVILPNVTSVASFDFEAHSDRKWEAIMEGFAAATVALNKGYKLTVDQFLAAKQIIIDFNGLVLSARKAPQGKLSENTLTLLKEKGIVSPGFLESSPQSST